MKYIKCIEPYVRNFFKTSKSEACASLTIGMHPTGA